MTALWHEISLLVWLDIHAFTALTSEEKFRNKFKKSTTYWIHTPEVPNKHKKVTTMLKATYRLSLYL